MHQNAADSMRRVLWEAMKTFQTTFVLQTRHSECAKTYSKQRFYNDLPLLMSPFREPSCGKALNMVGTSAPKKKILAPPPPQIPYRRSGFSRPLGPAPHPLIGRTSVPRGIFNKKPTPLLVDAADSPMQAQTPRAARK